MTYSINFVKNNKFPIDKPNKCSYNIYVLFKKGGDNTVSDSIITLEEARFALSMMEKCGLSPHQAIECIEGYTERIRNLRLADLVDYIINTKLSPVQKHVLTDYWFKGINPAETAEALGMSLSAAYSAKNKAQKIIKDQLEPLVMYFNDLDNCDTAPITLACLETLKAQKSKETAVCEALKNLRIGKGASPSVLSKALGISENELLCMENGTKDVSIKTLADYCRVFNTDIDIQYVSGQWRLKWTDL